MGRTHALTGCVAGLAVAPLAGLDDLAPTIWFAVITAGWALVPDLDHRSASAARVLGPLTKALSWAVRHSTGIVYRLTKGARDEASEHRTVTHTAVFALVIGALLGVAGTLSAWVPVAVAAFGLLLAADRLTGWLCPLAGGALAVWFGTGTPMTTLLDTAGSLSWAVGIAAGLGCLVHTLGDMVTLSGAPLLFPLLIRGETYYEIRPPRLLRFRTGGRIENWLITPACCAALAALMAPAVASTLLNTT